MCPCLFNILRTYFSGKLIIQHNKSKPAFEDHDHVIPVKRDRIILV